MKDSGFKLNGFSDADHAGCQDTFKSTFGETQFLCEKLLRSYGFYFNKVPIYCDSKSVIAISCNPVQHFRTKHIVVRCHFIKEHAENGTIELYVVKTDYQLADIFTKSLLVKRFNYLVHRLEDIKVLKVKIQMKEIAIKELRRKLEVAQKEKDGIQLTVDKLENASKGLNNLIECQIVDNCKKGLGYKNYNAVSPPYTRNFMPPKPDLSYTSLDEFANKPIAENTKSSKEESKAVRKNNDALIIKEWVSDDEENNVTQPNIVKKTVQPNIVKKEFVRPRQ
nr:hypothetical protein [Tanacetum cinerariifolium]